VQGLVTYANIEYLISIRILACFREGAVPAMSDARLELLREWCYLCRRQLRASFGVDMDGLR
jgi:hypothetical protein